MTINLWFLLSGSLLYILLISLLLIRRRFTVVTVSGYSMYPILQNGDRLLVLRYRSFRKYQTRQIVVIHPPYDNFRQEKLYVKWLTGLPGDQVTIPSSRLNRQIHSIQTNECNEQGSITWRIPEGHCFVKGESHWSEDSLVWGPIPLHCLVGIVLLKLPRRTQVSTPPLLTIEALASSPPDCTPADKKR